MLPPVQPLISVIIAFLNEERFLAEAIESVLHQDYTNWEIILVDDGCSDKSVQIAKDYEKRFQGKIIYIDHEGHLNKGLSASRNAGIKKASGELIALLDADDVWLPSKLSAQVSIFQQYPTVAMVAEASLYWYSWNNPVSQDIIIPVGASQNRVYQAAELLQYLYPLSTGAAPCPSGLIFTKQALELVGGFEEHFRKEYQLYEDQALLHKIYLKEQVYVSSECNNKYRQRVGSIVEKVHADGHYLSVRRYFLEWLKGYLEQERMYVQNNKRLVLKALFPYRHPTMHYFTTILPDKVKQRVKKEIKKLKR
ncbi:glycosyltransferase family 2 protein [Pontibacter sp. MBLB2868]|uniref:glycosyltransferase family 2 protein n=1 Tax=Pontibacter sp. MBLB2868 TaxID=3451555 RepID=UPI003F74DB1A